MKCRGGGVLAVSHDHPRKPPRDEVLVLLPKLRDTIDGHVLNQDGNAH